MVKYLYLCSTPVSTVATIGLVSPRRLSHIEVESRSYATFVWTELLAVNTDVGLPNRSSVNGRHALDHPRNARKPRIIDDVEKNAARFQLLNALLQQSARDNEEPMYRGLGHGRPVSRIGCSSFRDK